MHALRTIHVVSTSSGSAAMMATRAHSLTRRWESRRPFVAAAASASSGGCGSASCACATAAASADSNGSSGGGCGSGSCACASRGASASAAAASSAAPLAAPTPEQQAELGTLQNEVSRLYALGEYETALSAAVDAVELSLRLFGAAHPSHASALNNAALLHKVHRQDYAAAAQLYQRALDAYGASVGDQHPSYLTALNNLALACRAQGQLEDAQMHLEHVVAMHRQRDAAEAQAQAAAVAAAGSAHAPGAAVAAAPSKGSLPLASSLLSLGGVLGDRGQHARALELQSEALLMLRRRCGDEHPATATAMNNLALTHKTLGQHAQALQLHQSALAIRSRNLPPAHPDIVVSLNNLAELLRAMGQTDKAALLQEKILQIIDEQHQPQQGTEAADSEKQSDSGSGTWNAKRATTA